jgi:hypothetical protein
VAAVQSHSLVPSNDNRHFNLYRIILTTILHKGTYFLSSPEILAKNVA